MTKRNYLTVCEVNRAAQTVQRLAWLGADKVAADLGKCLGRMVK
jgi:hypothetical protein